MEKNKLITSICEKASPGKALPENSVFNHPISEIKVIETHISWVLLTGKYAYKIKKPVNLGFVDFTSLEKRKYFCEEELRLNQVLASPLYIAVVAIIGTPENPKINNNEKILEKENPEREILDYAVKMHQFDQKQLLTILLENIKNHSDYNIYSQHIMKLAIEIADFHLHAEKKIDNNHFGSPDLIKQEMMNNFNYFKNKKDDISEPLKEQLTMIEEWSKQEYNKKLDLFIKRKETGFIRDCHGDLHLGNMVLMDEMDDTIANKILVFDRLEFNPNFRMIDIIDEVAFLMMDFKKHNQERFAFLFLNKYLEKTGDYKGLALLQFYQVYRAMVRAKVASLTKASLEENKKNNKNLVDNFNTEFSFYLTLSEKIIKTKKPKIIITHGVSGSGKTHFSKQYAIEHQAIHIRSDVERKRLFPDIHGSALYTPDKSAMTFKYLLLLTEKIVQANFTVMVDATFLSYSSRKPFLELAKKLNIPFQIYKFECNEEVRNKRIHIRFHEKQDASDADIKIMKEQEHHVEPLKEDEIPYTIIVNTDV